MGKKVTPAIIAGICGLVLTGLFTSDLFSNVGGAPVARSGAPFESSCATSSCHSGTLNSGPGSVTIESDAIGNTWVPGQTYNFTVRVSQTGIQRWGFEVLSAHTAATNVSLGTTVLTNATATQIKTFSNKKYVTHRQAGTSGSTDFKEWTFQWQAPATDEGDVTFYAIGNAANNNGSRTGDQIYTNSLTLFNIGVGVEDEVGGMNAFQVFPTTVTDRISVRMENTHLSNLDIRIISLDGKEVAHWNRQPAMGETFLEGFDISNLNQGLYILMAEGKMFHQAVKFVKF